MIPSHISPDIKSSAEYKIFNAFKNTTNTEGWVVLHSLGLSTHQTQKYGEIDFLVLVPGMGIFVLEIKGGRVSREEGIWKFTDRFGKVNTKAKGPFEQARDNMFSLRNHLNGKSSQDCDYSKVNFAYGVMFPDIEFVNHDPDIEQWQIYDIRNQENIFNFITKLAQETAKKMGYPSFYPPKCVKHTTNLLRGDFDKAVSLSVKIHESEKQIINLTNEQLRCLDQLEDNSRCLISGPAGTGKTLLAIEQLKRNTAAGEKTAFFCFNSKLADFLKTHIESSSPAFTPAYLGTFHSFLLDKAKKHNPNITNEFEFSNEFFKEILPLLALEMLEKENELFDRIIIDEAQDLFCLEYLEILDNVLLGGLSRGKWTMFGDFISQSIFSDVKDLREAQEELDKITAYIKFKLTINCRNTKPICNSIFQITGYEWDDILNKTASGTRVNYFTYEDVESQISKLDEIIERLLKQNHIPEGSITILSPQKRCNISLNKSKYQFQEYSSLPQNCLTFSTIQAFKGLENSIVILIDIDSLEDIDLLYVGMSRARAALFILLSEEANRERQKKWRI